MKHRLALLITGIIIGIVGLGVGLVVLVWVLRRVLDANGRVVDELAGALKRVTTPEPVVDYGPDGVPHVLYPDPAHSDFTVTPGWGRFDTSTTGDDDAIRAAAAEVQAIANQLAEPATYLDHTDEFVPEETDALFGPPPTIPAQEFVKDFANTHTWPGE